MRTEVLSTTSSNTYQHAVDVLQNSGVVAFPTDTVYGLAALVADETAIRRLYGIKERSPARAIAILLGDIADLEEVALPLGKAVQKLARRFWPGPLTLVLPRQPTVSDLLTSDQTIGVRIPAHPVALKLLRLTGPLAVTSANLTDQPNTITASEVLSQLGGRVHLVLDGGPAPGKLPSTVVDATQDSVNILREGPISAQDLKAALEA